MHKAAQHAVLDHHTILGKDTFIIDKDRHGTQLVIPSMCYVDQGDQRAGYFFSHILAGDGTIDHKIRLRGVPDRFVGKNSRQPRIQDAIISPCPGEDGFFFVHQLLMDDIDLLIQVFGVIKIILPLTKAAKNITMLQRHTIMETYHHDIEDRARYHRPQFGAIGSDDMFLHFKDG